MPQKPSRRSGRTLAHPTCGLCTVCVVDPQASDYQGWTEAAKTHGVRIDFVTSATAALRLARESQVGLWVINATLPDRSGSELCGMLRQRTSAAIYLVADEYSPELERAAWAARPTLFACKPGHTELLPLWLRDRPASAPMRSGQSPESALEPTFR